MSSLSLLSFMPRPRLNSAFPYSRSYFMAISERIGLEREAMMPMMLSFAKDAWPEDWRFDSASWMASAAPTSLSLSSQRSMSLKS